MKNITHIFFDLDHTLWDTDKNSEESLNELFTEMELAELGIPSFKVVASPPGQFFCPAFGTDDIRVDRR